MQMKLVFNVHIITYTYIGHIVSTIMMSFSIRLIANTQFILHIYLNLNYNILATKRLRGRNNLHMNRICMSMFKLNHS